MDNGPVSKQDKYHIRKRLQTPIKTSFGELKHKDFHQFSMKTVVSSIVKISLPALEK